MCILRYDTRYGKIKNRSTIWFTFWQLWWVEISQGGEVGMSTLFLIPIWPNWIHAPFIYQAKNSINSIWIIKKKKKNHTTKLVCKGLKLVKRPKWILSCTKSFLSLWSKIKRNWFQGNLLYLFGWLVFQTLAVALINSIHQIEPTLHVLVVGVTLASCLF